MLPSVHPVRDPISESTTAAVYRLFAEGWKSGHSPALQDAIKAVLPAYRATLFPRLFQVEIHFRRHRGEQMALESYVAAFPEFEKEIRALGTDHSDSLPLTGGSTVSLYPGKAGEDESVVIVRGDDQLFRIGRYELERMVGVGGFAVVWLARDPSLDRPVAIKVPRSDRRTPTSCGEMLEEARRISRLNLPGVVPVLDVVDEQERFYIVSQFMEGGTLTARLQAGRMAHAEACELVATIADTLHRAHLKGVLHRDIKPSNILLDEHGKPWVADFGLATTEAEQWKDCGAVLGTVSYMSPEQARGEGHLVDGRTDVYSLGMVLYELLTGRVAFLGNSQAEILEQILKRTPRPPRTLDESISPELERICLRCLSKDVSARYSTAGDLARDLRAWLADERASAAASPAQRAWWVYGIAPVIALVLVALAIFLPSSSIIGARPQGGDDVIASHEEQHWVKQLGQSPREVIWPGYRGLGTNGFLDEIRLFQITSQAPRLFQLGTLDNQSGLLSINLRQPDWNGGCGLFFGYQEKHVEGHLRAEFHAILLQPVDENRPVKRLQVRRGQYYLSPDDGTLYPLVEIGEQDIPWPPAESLQRLELQFNEDGLVSGRWGREQFSTIIERTIGQVTPRSSLNGRWGILHENGTSWFQDPRLSSPSAVP